MRNASAQPTNFRETAGTCRRSNLWPSCAPHAAQQQAYLEAQISAHVSSSPANPEDALRTRRMLGGNPVDAQRTRRNAQRTRRTHCDPGGRSANSAYALRTRRVPCEPGGRSANPEDALRTRRTLSDPRGRSANPEDARRNPGGRSANPEKRPANPEYALRTRRTLCEPGGRYANQPFRSLPPPFSMVVPLFTNGPHSSSEKCSALRHTPRPRRVVPNQLTTLTS